MGKSEESNKGVVCVKCGKVIEDEPFHKVKRQGIMCQECFRDYDLMLSKNKFLSELKRKFPERRWKRTEYNFKNDSRIDFLVDTLDRMIEDEYVIFVDVDTNQNVCFYEIKELVKRGKKTTV